MKLSNFEKNINTTILHRGQSYYQTKTIESLEEVSDGTWEAQVEGTDLYSIEVSLSGDTITYHYCNCPYDMGDVCKHVVAVFYALKHQTIAAQTDQSPKKMTVKKKLQVIIDKLSEQDIKDYLQDTVFNNKKQRDHFLIHFDYLLGETANPNKYRQMVQAIIYQYSDHGFIDYHASSGVCNELTGLLSQARASLKNNPQLSFTISSIVLEAIPEMAQSMDDSNGESSTVFYQAIEIIIKYLKQADETTVQSTFKWCMKIYMNKEYSDYGYDEVDQLFNYFCTKNSPYKDNLLEVLNQKIEKASDYAISSLLSTKSELLALWGDLDASRQIIMDNLDHTEFRNRLIEEVLITGDDTEAIKLIHEGIQIAEKKQHAGTVRDWQKKLLNIAQQQSNQQDIAHWAEVLLLDQFSMDYYRIFKQTSLNWASDYPRLLINLKDSEYDLARIYEEESDHVALFKLITSNTEQSGNFFGRRNHLHLLKQYMDSLSLHYSNEILEIFSEDIYQRAKQTGRNIYAGIVDDLNIMKKLEGGEDKVKSIIIDFQKRYGNRPAMQEMLSKIY